MLILFSGPPASGKTTLAKIISEKLLIPFLGRDEIKEVLFDSLGVIDVEWSRKLGKASFEVLFFIIKKMEGHNLIVDCNYDPSSPPDFFKELKVLEVFITADESVLIERFKSRWNSGQRHRGHQDDKRFLEFEKNVGERNNPLHISEKIILHRNSFQLDSSANELLNKIKLHLKY